MSDDKTQIVGSNSAVRIGTELNQTYKIDTLIGVGGMGEVFKGHNIQTGDPVAIKIVLPEFARDDMILELFRKEARILNHLNHDAIVRYYVFSIDRAVDRPYLAMEFVDGQSLAERVKTTPLTPDDFMPLLRRLADGLHKAHEAGVIHRDMSPDNVILPGGLVRNAKIIDFGIARSANVGGGTLLGGSFAGKYGYVSPEQLGLFGGDVTPKSDIYSLALVMAAAMRGQPIDMGGSQVEVIEKRRSVPDLTGIPKQFHAVLTAMLQPDPARRPSSMADVRDWPDEIAADKPKVEKPSGAGFSPVLPPMNARPKTPGVAKPSNAMRNVALIVAAVAVVGLGVLAGFIFVKGDLTRNSAPVVTSREQPAPEEPAALPTPQQQKPADRVELEKPVTVIESKPHVEKPPVEPPITRPEQQSQADIGNASSLRDLVKNFGAGNCLAATVVDMTDTKAEITVVGTAQTADELRQAFATKAGFAPNLIVDQVSDAQCPFVASLRSMTVGNAQPIAIDLGKSEIRGNNPDTGAIGDPLNVTVTGRGERNLYLFILDHKGGIQNINRLCASCIVMTADGITAALSLFSPSKTEDATPPPFYPMLVVAVASPRPLISINSQDAYDEADFIGPFLKEISSASNVSTAVAYVRLMDQ